MDHLCSIQIISLTPVLIGRGASSSPCQNGSRILHFFLVYDIDANLPVALVSTLKGGIFFSLSPSFYPSTSSPPLRPTVLPEV